MSGVRIGAATIRWEARQIQPEYRWGLPVYFVAAPGTLTPGSVDQRTATGVLQLAGTTVSVFVLFSRLEG